MSKLVLESNGSTRLETLGRNGTVERGEILSVDQEAGNARGRVTLAGAVTLPGTRSLDEVPTMSRLLRQPGDLAVNAYTPLGILVHLEPHTNFRRAVAFSVARVLTGEEDLKLSEGDLVFVMSSPQAQALALAQHYAILSRGQIVERGPISELQVAASQKHLAV